MALIAQEKIKLESISSKQNHFRLTLRRALINICVSCNWPLERRISSFYVHVELVESDLITVLRKEGDL